MTVPIRLQKDLMLPYLQLQFGTDLVLGRKQCDLDWKGQLQSLRAGFCGGGGDVTALVWNYYGLVMDPSQGLS